MNKKPLIVGNWKMYKTVKESLETAKKIKGSKLLQVAIAAPFTSIYALKTALKGRQVKLVGQNVHYLDSGNFTGEISPVMLKEAGCEYVIIGHSERRHFFNEDEDFINSKVLVCLSYGLKVILCVGETLDAMRKNINEDYVSIQISRNLYKIKNLENLIIAYEPVWAVSSNVTASLNHISKMHEFIRREVYENYKVNPQILYGGSVNAENCVEILGTPNVDGLLIGQESLDHKSFNKIIKLAEAAKKL